MFLKYKHLKLIFLVLSVLIMVLGVWISARATRSDVVYTPFEINESEVARYGHFASFNMSRTAIRGLILTPKEPVYGSNGLRPAIFFFHGMFARKEAHIHYAMELARAGFVVIMPDHSGQGDSLGTYNLGLDIQALGLTMVDWLLDEGNSTYDLRINPAWIGATGHSYGGATTTMLGANAPDKISAAVSIWTWSNLTETVGDIFGIAPDKIFESGTWRLISFSNFLLAISEPYGSETKEQLRANLEYRNIYPKLNGTPGNPRPRNWLLITSYDDELTKPERQAEAMAYACANSSDATPLSEQVAMYEKYILENVTKNDNNTWTYPGGSFENGTMRRIFLLMNYSTSDGTGGHMMEGFYQPPLNMMIRWFGDAWGWDVDKYYFDAGKAANVSIPTLKHPIAELSVERFVGYIIFGLGFAILIFPLNSYATKLNKSEEEYQKLQTAVPEKISAMQTKSVLLMVAVYILAYIAGVFPTPSIALWMGITPQLLGVPYVVTDVTVILQISRLFTMLPILAVILLFEKKKFNISYGDIGLGRGGLGPAVAVGIVLPLFLLLVINIAGFITVFPMVYPAESPSLGYLSAALVMFYFLIIAVFNEVYFRGLMQTKLDSLVMRAKRINNMIVKKWASFIVCASASVLTIWVASVLSFSPLVSWFEVTRSGNLAGNLFVLGLNMAIAPSIINTYVYQRTRNITGCILLTTVFFGIWFSSHFFGIGAVAF